MTLDRWMRENTGPTIWWYVKRLSGNDTRANGAHQDGPYIPKDLLFEIFPSLANASTVNPDVLFDLYLDPEAVRCEARAVWYNNKLHGQGTRNEARVTRVGGASSPLLDPESTGAIAVFAFHKPTAGDAEGCRVWVARELAQEELLEEHIGIVEPGVTLWSPSMRIGTLSEALHSASPSSCRLSAAEIPPNWLTNFPTGREIIAHTIRLCPDRGAPVGARLLKRRSCEYEVFQSIEEAVELPTAQRGFDSMDAFLSRAQSVLQRRKSRSGRSLELHLEAVFVEEGLIAGSDFEYQAKIEGGKTPDFLFPGTAAYRDSTFSPDRLRILGVKTSCRDRWRQVLNEADRIPRKHIFTLQEGVSANQFREMDEAGVTLVVPEPLVSKFASELRPKLVGLGDFLQEVRSLRR